MSAINNYQKQFADNGYVVIDNAYTQQELTEFQTVLSNLTALELTKATQQHPDLTSTTTGTLIDQQLLTLRQANPQYLVNIQRTLSRSPEFFRLNTNAKVMAVLQELLGMPQERPLYMTNNGILFTSPHSTHDKHPSNIALPWHNDIFHTIPKSRFIQIWAPLLYRADKKIGTLIVCPGSHKEGVGKQQFDPDAKLFFHRYTISAEEAARFPQQSIELELGQCLIFSSTIIHRSGNNTSNHMRVSMVGAYHDPDSPEFAPLSVSYQYYGLTPEAYYYELFKDPRALPLIDEQKH